MKQIDAERQAFREAPGVQPRPPSPQIAPQPQAYFPVEEVYVPSTPAYNNVMRMDSSDDPDVWRPPTREAPFQYGSRRPTKAGQMAAAAQAKRMAVYARGAADRGVGPQVGRGSKLATTGVLPRGTGVGAAGVGAGVKGMSNVGGQPARKSTGRSTPSKRDSLVYIFKTLAC